jgi:hypothetical protein
MIAPAKIQGDASFLLILAVYAIPSESMERVTVLMFAVFSIAGRHKACAENKLHKLSQPYEVAQLITTHRARKLTTVRLTDWPALTLHDRSSLRLSDRSHD